MANAVWAAVPEPVSSLTQNMKPYEPLCSAIIQLLVAVMHRGVFDRKSHVAPGAAADVQLGFEKTFNIHLMCLFLGSD